MQNRASPSNEEDSIDSPDVVLALGAIVDSFYNVRLDGFRNAGRYAWKAGNCANNDYDQDDEDAPPKKKSSVFTADEFKSSNRAFPSFHVPEESESWDTSPTRESKSWDHSTLSTSHSHNLSSLHSTTSHTFLSDEGGSWESKEQSHLNIAVMESGDDSSAVESGSCYTNESEGLSVYPGRDVPSRTSRKQHKDKREISEGYNRESKEEIREEARENDRQLRRRSSKGGTRSSNFTGKVMRVSKTYERSVVGNKKEKRGCERTQNDDHEMVDGGQSGRERELPDFGRRRCRSLGFFRSKKFDLQDEEEDFSSSEAILARLSSASRAKTNPVAFNECCPNAPIVSPQLATVISVKLHDTQAGIRNSSDADELKSIGILKNSDPGCNRGDGTNSDLLSHQQCPNDEKMGTNNKDHPSFDLDVTSNSAQADRMWSRIESLQDGISCADGTAIKDVPGRGISAVFYSCSPQIPYKDRWLGSHRKLDEVVRPAGTSDPRPAMEFLPTRSDLKFLVNSTLGTVISVDAPDRDGVDSGSVSRSPCASKEPVKVAVRKSEPRQRESATIEPSFPRTMQNQTKIKQNTETRKLGKEATSEVKHPKEATLENLKAKRVSSKRRLKIGLWRRLFRIKGKKKQSE